jgi:uncharacterized protein (TIGR01244 family)
VKRIRLTSRRLILTGPVLPALLFALVATGLACSQEPRSRETAPDTATETGEPASEAAPAPAPEIQIPNARMPLDGVLTGGQPTEEQLAELADAGYRTVVNLRTPGENEISDREAELAEKLGLRYVQVPVAGAEGLTEANVRKLADLLEDGSGYPLVVHCGSGNRVGALFALKALQIDGKSAEEALQIGKQAGLTRLEPVVREKLGLSETP